ncbi:hypothetical protein [Intrasporangium calvum]|nr:hypothetical protein [Intrasporangium calvum]
MQEGTPAFVGVFEHGPIDAILPVEALAETADRALNVLMGIREGPPDVPDVPDVPTESLAASPAWDSIVRSRRAHRPACAPCS